MSRFQTKYDMRQRTVEHCAGPYLVSLEGYFDFNEAIAKLMIINNFYAPTASQFEPGSDSDDDEDFVEPQFDDVCDALQTQYDLEDKLKGPSEPVKQASKALKPDSDDEPSDTDDSSSQE